jgi:DNA-binding GntR family transcriptional regulator
MADLKGQLHQASLRDQVLAVLRTGLATGDLVPGQLYSATTIANQLGVSASPVREAMLTLANQGVVEPVRNRGYRIVELRDDDRDDIYELRMLLEIPGMVRLIGNPEVRHHEEEFRRLADEIVAAVDNQDAVGFLNSDLQFHMGLLKFGGNEKLCSIVETLRIQTRKEGLQTLMAADLLHETAEQHHLILDAILQGDEGKLRELMADHLAHIQSDWGPAIRSMPSEPDRRSIQPFVGTPT